jgi:hypothetical protein
MVAGFARLDRHKENILHRVASKSIFPIRLPTAMKTLILLGTLLLASCGGTFTLRPDGSIAYTTPEILKAPIVEPAK